MQIEPAIYQALAIRKALEFYNKTGMRVNRAYTPGAMVRTAWHITGKKRTSSKKGRELAIQDLTQWLEAHQ